MIIFIAFVAVALGYYVLGNIYAKYWGFKLEINAHLPEHNVYEGETAIVTEKISNNKFLPLPVLETFFKLDKGLRYLNKENSAFTDNLYRRDVFAIGAKQKIERTFEISCEKRGYYTLQEIELMSSNLFLSETFLDKRQIFSSFCVYPRKVREEQIALPYKKIMGEILVHKRMQSDPFSFGGMREYVKTDPMNSINWKASAKACELIVNVYDSSTQQKVILLLDTYENTLSYSDALNEEAIRIASALSERFLHQGVELTLLSNAKDIITEKPLAIQHYISHNNLFIQTSLARLKLGTEDNFANLFCEVPKDSLVIIVSKNQEMQKEIENTFTDFLWLVPYKNDLPNHIKSNHKILPWKYNTGRID